MRSTLTLEPDVAHQVQELVAASRKPYKMVVNELLRRGLASKPNLRQPFVQPTLELGWNDTLDPAGFNRLTDALAVEADAAVLERFENAP
jgi:hypothetical protein